MCKASLLNEMGKRKSAVLSGSGVVFPFVRVHPLVSQVNQLIDAHVRLFFGQGNAL